MSNDYRKRRIVTRLGTTLEDQLATLAGVYAPSYDLRSARTELAHLLEAELRRTVRHDLRVDNRDVLRPEGSDVLDVPDWPATVAAALESLDLVALLFRHDWTDGQDWPEPSVEMFARHGIPENLAWESPGGVWVVELSDERGTAWLGRTSTGDHGVIPAHLGWTVTLRSAPGWAHVASTFPPDRLGEAIDWIAERLGYATDPLTAAELEAAGLDLAACEPGGNAGAWVIQGADDAVVYLDVTAETVTAEFLPSEQTRTAPRNDADDLLTAVRVWVGH